MDGEPGIAEAARLFKVLGSESRLGLLRLIEGGPRTVGALAEVTGMSQPLVSQHLRTLRQAGLLTPTRAGKEVIYRVTDLHVAHIVADALAHVREPAAARVRGLGLSTLTTKGNGMTTDANAKHATAEHTTTEHEHGLDCGHETVQHDDHVDYVHDDHKHALHGDHYDEH